MSSGEADLPPMRRVDVAGQPGPHPMRVQAMSAEFGDCRCGKEAICMYKAGERETPVCEDHLAESLAEVKALIQSLAEGAP